MELVRFKEYKDGYYSFEFENGELLVFEEIHPKVLTKYNLKGDKTLIDELFYLSYSEIVDDDQDNLIIYRIEYLELININ